LKEHGMADFVDEKRREMEARIKELRPLVDEYHRLEAAVHALEGVGSEATRRPRRPAPARAAASNGDSDDGQGRRGRPRGSGTRGKQALELVRARPGITIPELAEEMSIQQNYLYRVLPSLQKDGLVRKEGRGWHALDAA
jgi:hypothetical protein